MWLLGLGVLDVVARCEEVSWKVDDKQSLDVCASRCRGLELGVLHGVENVPDG